MIDIVFVIGIILLFIVLKIRNHDKVSHHQLSEHLSKQERAGKQGERYFNRIIYKYLHDEDIMLSNVKLNRGRQAELDTVIITHYGVFIFEVKNYSGVLIGKEDDDQWIQQTKYKTIKLRNPIIQLNREMDILEEYLNYKGYYECVYGYVYMINHNAPIDSNFILNDIHQADSIIHDHLNRYLSVTAMAKIRDLLKQL